MFFPALVDCWLRLSCPQQNVFYDKKGAFMWDMQDMGHLNFRRHTHKNSPKNDIFLYKNLQVYTNFSGYVIRGWW